tara:strand:+ start:205 stop:711 length:507 start_codon:yes stop_codon:yes gene_type:complete
MLPLELSARIYRRIQHNAVNLIITAWYKHIGKKTLATVLILKITDHLREIIPDNNFIIPVDNNIYNNVYRVDCFNPYVRYVLQYCNNVLTGIEDREWWDRKLSIIRHSIYALYNDFNYANIQKQKIYLDICLLYKKINDKFNLTDNFIQNNIINIPNNNILLNSSFIN